MKLKGKKIFIAGHKGMVGSGFYRRLKEDGCSELVVKSRSELDLLNLRLPRRQVTRDLFPGVGSFVNGWLWLGKIKH